MRGGVGFEVGWVDVRARRARCKVLRVIVFLYWLAVACLGVVACSVERVPCMEGYRGSVVVVRRLVTGIARRREGLWGEAGGGLLEGIELVPFYLARLSGELSGEVGPRVISK